MTKVQTDSEWRIQKRPVGMSKRFEFESYEATRQFLDDLADLSERTGYYPNLNFNRTHVSISIQTEAESLSEEEQRFAKDADALMSSKKPEGFDA